MIATTSGRPSALICATANWWSPSVSPGLQGEGLERRRLRDRDLQQLPVIVLSAVLVGRDLLLAHRPLRVRRVRVRMQRHPGGHVEQLEAPAAGQLARPCVWICPKPGRFATLLVNE